MGTVSGTETSMVSKLTRIVGNATPISSGSVKKANGAASQQHGGVVGVSVGLTGACSFGGTQQQQVASAALAAVAAAGASQQHHPTGMISSQQQMGVRTRAKQLILALSGGWAAEVKRQLPAIRW